jgi:hypothetical protein
MKKAILLKNRTTELSFFFECPFCGEILRRKRCKKTEKNNYQGTAPCTKCGKRMMLVGPNKGPRKKDNKILCPECKKNKMSCKSRVCSECYLKNPKKYRTFSRRNKDEFER